jgi:hypothetical protein
MELHADFSRRASAHPATTPWVPSPMPGVERRMLDRIGDEVARATSLVRYAAGSAFSPHTHTGGEEYLVLEGVFSDEHGDFPVGTYVRNPPTSRHTPRSDPGAVIFVKLWQFDPADRAAVTVRWDALPWTDAADGVALRPLFEDEREAVRLERWAPDTRVGREVEGGAEILVLAGGFEEGGEIFGPRSWLRLPPGARLSAEAGPEGAEVWVKEGHLVDAAARFWSAFEEARRREASAEGGSAEVVSPARGALGTPESRD